MPSCRDCRVLANPTYAGCAGRGGLPLCSCPHTCTSCCSSTPAAGPVPAATAVPGAPEAALRPPNIDASAAYPPPAPATSTTCGCCCGWCRPIEVEGAKRYGAIPGADPRNAEGPAPAATPCGSPVLPAAEVAEASCSDCAPSSCRAADALTGGANAAATAAAPPPARTSGLSAVRADSRVRESWGERRGRAGAGRGGHGLTSHNGCNRP